MRFLTSVTALVSSSGTARWTDSFGAEVRDEGQRAFQQRDPHLGQSGSRPRRWLGPDSLDGPPTKEDVMATSKMERTRYPGVFKRVRVANASAPEVREEGMAQALPA